MIHTWIIRPKKTDWWTDSTLFSLTYSYKEFNINLSNIFQYTGHVLVNKADIQFFPNIRRGNLIYIVVECDIKWLNRSKIFKILLEILSWS